MPTPVDHRSRPFRRRPTAAGALAATVYGIAAWLAVWGFSWPQWSARLPLGTEDVATVPLFNAWTIGWNADRARAAGRGYWQAPIFAPHPAAFVLSEAQPHFLLLAPLTTATSPAVTYNLYLLMSLMLNGVFAARLIRRTGAGSPAAFFGGLLAVILPFAHWSLGVLQLVPVWGILWSLERVLAYAQKPRLKKALLIGVAGFVTYLLCNYYGLFLAIVMIPFAMCLLIGRGVRTVMLAHLLGGVGVAVLLASPVLWKQWQVLNHEEYERDADLIRELSARPAHLLVPPEDRLPRLGSGLLSQSTRSTLWRLGVGSIWSVTAMGGVIAGLLRRSRRRWTLAVLLLGTTAAALALGMNLSIGGVEPYQSLQGVIPPLRLLRSPFRFIVFTQLALMLLAAEAMDGLLALSRPAVTVAPARRSAQSGRRWLMDGIVAAWVGLICWQVGPAVSPLTPVPQFERHSHWIECLRRSTRADEPIACLPFPSERMPQHYTQTTRWMYLGLWHKRPLVNGYSGYFPKAFRDLKEQVQSFPDQPSLQALLDAGVRTCVVEGSSYEAATLPRSQPLALQPLCQDEAAGISVYRIEPAAANR